ncbi:26055_t:CDS:2 [Gigaspora rosea]|nr:26054_t:CDS:2 [Gigaspora rosea]CAG8460449.1 26055_t:CDS:2 [Gigaspora rosea]
MYDEWISHEDNIDIGLIQRSFKCCGISNTTNGSENDLILTIIVLKVTIMKSPVSTIPPISTMLYITRPSTPANSPTSIAFSTLPSFST